MEGSIDIIGLGRFGFSWGLGFSVCFIEPPYELIAIAMIQSTTSTARKKLAI